MNSKSGKVTFAAMVLGMLPVLSSCAPPVGWGTDVTATSLNGDQWQVEVVITKHPNHKHAKDYIVSAPTLICRGGESAEMRVGDGREDEDLISIQIDTAENPGTDEMTFTVMVRERGLLRSRTSLKVQPDEGARSTSAMAGDTRSK